MLLRTMSARGPTGTKGKRKLAPPIRRAARPAPRPAGRDASDGEPAGSFPVVGVGASAGGLEAFSALLGGIPADTPLAIVLVQHTASGHESRLPNLLGPVTSMTVTTARNGARPEPGCVYVIPQDSRLTLTDGHLAVARQTTAGSGDAPIDRFF